MELTIAILKPFLPGLEAVLDDEAVSEVMINDPAPVIVERTGRAFTIEEVPASGSPPRALVEPAAAVLGADGSLARCIAFRHSRSGMVEHAPPPSGWNLKEATGGGAVEPGSGPGSRPR